MREEETPRLLCFRWPGGFLYVKLTRFLRAIASRWALTAAAVFGAGVATTLIVKRVRVRRVASEENADAATDLRAYIPLATAFGVGVATGAIAVGTAAAATVLIVQGLNRRG